jgi:hypothetical protein
MLPLSEGIVSKQSQLINYESLLIELLLQLPLTEG